MSPTRIGGSPADGPHDEGNDGGRSAALHARGRALELSTTKATTVSAPRRACQSQGPHVV